MADDGKTTDVSPNVQKCLDLCGNIRTGNPFCIIFSLIAHKNILFEEISNFLNRKRTNDYKKHLDITIKNIIIITYEM